MTLKPLDDLSPVLVEPIRSFARRVQEASGAGALGWTIYGAAAAGSFDPARHVVHNVLVLESVDLEVLKRLARDCSRPLAVRVAPPVVLTPAYIRTSLDTFPLELIEIRQQHRTVFGQDDFEDLTFEPAQVRLECERELKTMLLAMRQSLLISAGDDERIGELTRHSADGILRTLRGLLWLKRQTAATPAHAAVEQVEAAIGRPLPGVRDLLDARARGWPHFQRLYADLDALAGQSDRW